MHSIGLNIRKAGELDYQSAVNAMQAFTLSRKPQTRDEIWFLQHPPVFTQGLSCKTNPKRSTRIPVVKTDRGGQITYHGPGQLIVYVLIDIKRLGRGPKWLVQQLEESVIVLLSNYQVSAHRMTGAPGVYVDGAKIAALGLRIKKGASYHGLSLNIDMDLQPFSVIDPCGYKDLPVTSLRKLGVNHSFDEVEAEFQTLICNKLSYNDVETMSFCLLESR